MIPINSTKNGIVFKVKIQPGSSKNEITGVFADCLKIKVSSPPEKGKANKAVIKVLSKKLDIPAKQIEIIQGLTSAQKQICIYGLSEVELIGRLKHF